MNEYKCLNSKTKIEKVDISMKREMVGNIVQSLSVCLASTYTLYLKTQGYHWNVVGPQFASLHLLFETQYKDLSEAADVIAERIRALGHPAPASFEQFSKLSSIKESTQLKSAAEMIQDLLNDNENMAQLIQQAIRVAQESNDEGTADICIERIRQHEKHAWMLRALLG